MSKGRPNPKLWKPVKGVHIETGEVVKFNHTREAVEKLRNDDCKICQSGIIRMIKLLEEGKTHYITGKKEKPYHHAGYRWYHDT
jgi:hypothetical protein